MNCGYKIPFFYINKVKKVVMLQNKKNNNFL